MIRVRYIFLFAFIVALLCRFILNFSIPLVPGMGGGYTILQVRAILEQGHLAIPDMPLVFYFNALIVKLLSICFPNVDLNTLIINVVKVFDSIGLPLLLYPLYKISSNLFDTTYSRSFLITISLFGVLSYAPLELCSDAVKNSAGLMLMTFVMYYFLSYLKYQKRKDLILTSLFLVLTCLSHFGSFLVCLSFLLTGLIVVYRRKALLPIIGIVLAGALIIAAFDFQRAISMLSFWMKAFSIFLSPRLLYYPFGIFNYISSFLLIFFIIRVLKRKKEEHTVYKHHVLLILLIVLIILSFPFYQFEYGRRLGFFLFLPQSIALMLLYTDLKSRLRTVISYILIILVAFTAMFKLLNPKPMDITDEAYADMQKIGSEIKDPERTLIFCRHGLEWWVAWEHHVRIARRYIEVDDDMMQKYDQIFYLVEKKGENQFYPGKTTPAPEPIPPENSELRYYSEYFEMYELKRE